MNPEFVAILAGLIGLAFVITVLWLLWRIARAAERGTQTYRTCVRPNYPSQSSRAPAPSDDLDVEELWKP